jgi:hypothetical protein
MANTVTLDLVELHRIAVSSKKTKYLQEIAAQGIYRIIKATAPEARPYGLNYKPNFRITSTHDYDTAGWTTYLIAERFQWKWIEFGWTEWRDNVKHPGLYIMTNALLAYGSDDTYGIGVK